MTHSAQGHDFAAHMPVVDGFPRPDWRAIAELLAPLVESQAQEAWTAAAMQWVQSTARHLGAPYVVVETRNFLVLAPLDQRRVKLLQSFVEKARHEILGHLSGLASDEGFGKSVLLVFADQDAYYRYTAHFYAEGEHPLSSGVFLNADYAHIALPFHDLTETEATLAHELTHCYLRHLPIPLWLNEGLAVTLENDLCANHALRMDPDRLAEHRAFWTAQTIQEFWNGQSFARTDEGIGLSYELARYCIRALAHDLQAFVAFANQALRDDGGEAAAMELFGGSLGGLIEQFFGAGEWSPQPLTWRCEPQTDTSIETPPLRYTDTTFSARQR